MRENRLPTGCCVRELPSFAALLLCSSACCSHWPQRWLFAPAATARHKRSPCWRFSPPAAGWVISPALMIHHSRLTSERAPPPREAAFFPALMMLTFCSSLLRTAIVISRAGFVNFYDFTLYYSQVNIILPLINCQFVLTCGK